MTSANNRGFQNHVWAVSYFNSDGATNNSYALTQENEIRPVVVVSK